MEKEREGSGAERSGAVGEAEFRPGGAYGEGAREPGATLAQAAENDLAGGLLSGNEMGRKLFLTGARKGRRLVKRAGGGHKVLSAEQRLLLLDTWKRSGLSVGEFSCLVRVSKQTLFAWRQRFEEYGPEGLLERSRGVKKGSRLPELTRRAILMLKESHPDYGCQRIADMLVRGPALAASPAAVARVLHEAGYELEEVPSRPHPQKTRGFERARPNQMWQTDLFTFVLRRQNRRVYLVGFLDDHSRFLAGYGLWASAPTALVLEVLRAAIASYGRPEEVLTDNGPQYVTWRGKSAFTKELEKHGIKQLVARPKHPQTLGKIERFWGTLWRECLETAVFLDLEDARRRVGQFIDHYNFHRPHQGLDGLVPADRYFEAAPQVLKTMRERVAANALELARSGLPKKPFYLTGQVGGKAFSVHSEGERVILTGQGEGREEVELVAPSEEKTSDMPEPVCPSVPNRDGVFEEDGDLWPGESPLDEGLEELRAEGEQEGGES